jgi:hypothetical protein
MREPQGAAADFALHAGELGGLGGAPLLPTSCQEDCQSGQTDEHQRQKRSGDARSTMRASRRVRGRLVCSLQEAVELGRGQLGAFALQVCRPCRTSAAGDHSQDRKFALMILLGVHTPPTPHPLFPAALFPVSTKSDRRRKRDTGAGVSAVLNGTWNCVLDAGCAKSLTPSVRTVGSWPR